MSNSNTYRDELAAAHGRIAQLEEGKRRSSHFSELAALERERARADGETSSYSVWPKLRMFFVVFWTVGGVFVFERDWVFGLLAFAAPFICGIVGQRIIDGNAASAVRQRDLIDTRIAEIRKTMSQTAEG